MSNNNFFEKFSYSYTKPNSKSYYIAGDCIERYKKNLITNEEILKKNNWIDTKITYSYNNYGFRTYDNFDIKNPQDGNMFFGCSITEGLGLNIEDTYAYKINKQLNNGNFYNMGQAGTGIETVYRLFKSWIPVLKPKNVFIMTIYRKRKEFINKKIYKYDIFAPWLIDERYNNTIGEKLKKVMFEQFLVSEEENEIFWERNWDAIKYAAKQYNFNFYKVNEEKFNDATIDARKKQSYARDCEHFGCVFHDIMSNLDNWEKIK